MPENLSNASSIARHVVNNCPAYADFLRANKIDTKKINFKLLPLTDKENYIKAYPLEQRLYRGHNLADYYMICTSSGSTGEPTIWPRDYDTDELLALPQTAFLEEHFQISRQKTLILISLGLGTTQAGMMHLKASWGANKVANVSVISPNGDSEMTIFLLQKLYKQYDQIVCLGYPPLVSDFLDLAIERKLPIKKWNLKIALTSQSISASWRRVAIETISGNPGDVVAWYGSTEVGMMGFETKEANFVLTQCLKNSELQFDLFQNYNLPTLVEANTLSKYMEVINGEMVITADQVVPLVRFNLHDEAMFITNQQMKNILQKHHCRTDAIDQKERLYVAIFGKKLHTVFSTEDINTVIDQENIYQLIHREFQFTEQLKNDHLILTLTLYVKRAKKISQNKINILNQNIKEKLEKIHQQPIELNLIIKDETQRVGYKSGKLRYLTTI